MENLGFLIAGIVFALVILTVLIVVGIRKTKQIFKEEKERKEKGEKPKKLSVFYRVWAIGLALMVTTMFIHFFILVGIWR